MRILYHIWKIKIKLQYCWKETLGVPFVTWLERIYSRQYYNTRGLPFGLLSSSLSGLHAIFFTFELHWARLVLPDQYTKTIASCNKQQCCSRGGRGCCACWCCCCLCFSLLSLLRPMLVVPNNLLSRTTLTIKLSIPGQTVGNPRPATNSSVTISWAVGRICNSTSLERAAPDMMNFTGISCCNFFIYFCLPVFQ